MSSQATGTAGSPRTRREFGEGPLARVAALVYSLLAIELLLLLTTLPGLIPLVLLDRDASNAPLAVACTIPLGPALSSCYATGDQKPEGGSITEGIGQRRITANLEDFKPDFAYQIPDAEALPIIFDLVQEEGLCLGGSTGINIAGAIRLARDLGPGHTIVTILCDYGTRYQSKLFNPAFLRTKGLPIPDWMDKKPDIAVPFEEVA